MIWEGAWVKEQTTDRTNQLFDSCFNSQIAFSFHRFLLSGALLNFMVRQSSIIIHHSICSHITYPIHATANDWAKNFTLDFSIALIHFIFLSKAWVFTRIFFFFSIFHCNLQCIDNHVLYANIVLFEFKFKVIYSAKIDFTDISILSFRYFWDFKLYVSFI